jgi:hypothetical protein
MRLPAYFASAVILAQLQLSCVVAVEDIDFTRDIKPILAEHCIKCHGPDKAEGGLDLTQRETALKDLDSGSKAIVPGQADQGELLVRVTSSDHDLRMPPSEEKLLDESQIEKLRKWIAAGAEFQIHWSFRELKKPKPPIVKDFGRVENSIDQFVVAKLDEEGFAPSPEAAPHQLIRRLSLDLIGLLPTPEAVQQFQNDYASAPDRQARNLVYEQLVDELLASPHFGERWGRHWLDLARYADSDGYEKDRPRPDAYVYRDWVIQAFNENLPFDQFTIQQLAGDLLPNATPKHRIATAFNRQTLTNTEGGVDQEEYRVAAVFDRTDTVGSVWLGLTVGCAKCHTHKYDPIPHSDYYRLFAFFNEADEEVEKLPINAENDEAMLAELLPLEQALRSRYAAIVHDEQRWEQEQRDLIESGKSTPLVVEEKPLTIDSSSKAGLAFTKQEDGSFVVSSNAAESTPEPQATIPETDTYTLEIHGLPEKFTGLRLETFPDKETGKGVSGFHSGGNFVVSRIAAVIIGENGQVVRNLPLQDAVADFQQTGFKAADVLGKKPNNKKGWAVSPKAREAHWLQVRTEQVESIAAGQSLRLTIEQLYGGKHLIRKFRIRAVTGDELELHLPKNVVQALKMYPEKRTNETRATLFEYYAQQDSEVKMLQSKIDEVHRKYQAQVMPVRMISTARMSRRTHRFDRGDFLSPAEEVAPGMLSALGNSVGPDQHLDRLDLARWLVSSENVLTPRVLANQYWSRLFGAGIVRSVGDFGLRGENPSHPELLDWLACTFRDDLAWNTKAFLKTILMSATYRQSSTHRPELHSIDPLNQWLARQNRIRVEAELVRDLALQVSGLLSTKVGGPSVFPPMPPELAKLSYANNFSWTPSQGEDRYRRGMYTFFKRTIPHPTLMTFDCPDANLTCINRLVSNTPLQALTLLNNESFHEAAQALSQRLLEKRSLDDQERLGLAVETCLNRPATADEFDRLENLLEHSRQYFSGNTEQAEALCGQLRIPNHSSPEVAAWIATVRVLLNLDEFITRE